MEKEGPLVLLVMVDIMPINLEVDIVVFLVHQVVMIVVLQTILMEPVQIAPLLQDLGDKVDMIKILNSKTNLNKV